MEVLEYEAERLPLRFTDQKTLDRVKHLALTLWRGQLHPDIITNPQGSKKKRQLGQQFLLA